MYLSFLNFTYSSILRVTTALVILTFSPHALATNMTQQWHLCKTDTQIEALRQANDLIRVDAKPTRAALMPVWPETLVTFAITIYGIATLRSKSSPLSTVIFKAVVPFITVVAWVMSFALTQRHYHTAGWISVDMATWCTFIMNAMAYERRQVNNRIGDYLSVSAVLLGIFQLVGSFIVAFKRLGKASATYRSVTVQVPLLGSTAYQTTDLHGCIPWNSTAYLEGGARSEIFRNIQAVQVNYSLVVLIIVACIVFNDDGGDHMGKVVRIFPYSTLLISLPLLIYEAVIATRGMPVVISGNCMLVELDPRFGFLDSEIDIW